MRNVSDNILLSKNILLACIFMQLENDVDLDQLAFQ